MDFAGLSVSLVLLALTRLSVVCFSGLLVRTVTVSLDKTCVLSVRRSEAVFVVDGFLACVAVVFRRSFSGIEADGTRGREEAVYVEVEVFLSLAVVDFKL